MHAIQFNGDEVFTMAEQIERNGARFYRAAATNNPRAKDLLLHLAEMEDSHLAAFEQMHKDFSVGEAETGAFDPEGEAAAYLSSLADAEVFDVGKDPLATLTGRESDLEIIRIAIGLEKDSIAYYVGMRELALGQADKERIDLIIKEEMQHVTLLRAPASGR
jgi:rubrerythrin